MTPNAKREEGAFLLSLLSRMLEMTEKCECHVIACDPSPQPWAHLKSKRVTQHDGFDGHKLECAWKPKPEAAINERTSCGNVASVWDLDGGIRVWLVLRVAGWVMLRVPVWVGMPAAATLAVLVGELVLAKVAVGVREDVGDGLALSCGVAEMQWPTGSKKGLDVVMRAQ